MEKDKNEIKLSGETIEKVMLDPENAGKGLIQLVLSIIQLVKELMEKQAIRRIEAGKLNEKQIDDIGETFLALEEKIKALKEQFGLSDEDIQLAIKNIQNLE